jgi:HSP20 family protein
MATLVKWAPFSDLDTVERRMRRMLEDMGVASARLPASDVLETDKELIVKLDAPGFDEKELSVEVSDRTLVVKGEKSEVKEEKDATFYLRERMENRFERTFALPTEADVTHVGATFEKGVLAVHVPKTARVTPRKIDIKA